MKRRLRPCRLITLLLAFRFLKRDRIKKCVAENTEAAATFNRPVYLNVLRALI